MDGTYTVNHARPAERLQQVSERAEPPPPLPVLTWDDARDGTRCARARTRARTRTRRLRPSRPHLTNCFAMAMVMQRRWSELLLSIAFVIQHWTCGTRAKRTGQSRCSRLLLGRGTGVSETTFPADRPRNTHRGYSWRAVTPSRP